MTTIYEKENDDLFLRFYQFSWIIVVLFGIAGLALFFSNTLVNIDLGFVESIVSNLVEIMILLAALSGAALLVGWIQVAITSKLGEEVVLLVTWITPFLVIATSIYLYLDTQDVNVLGGSVAGVVFLFFVIYFRKSLRLSARLIEVGAEVTTSNPALFVPQLIRVIATVTLTILVLPGLVVVFVYSAQIHGILAILLSALFFFLYTFAIAAFGAFADASNIAYINQWYGSGRAKLSKSKDEVIKMKAPIVRFAFLMAFISRFRSNNRKGFTPGKLFQYMNFSNWPRLLLRRGSVTSAAADTAAYFGSYTLVVIIVKKTKSVAKAYKASATAMFERFVENIAGSMGFNIIEGLRSFITAILMLAAGALYGYIRYNQEVWAMVLFAILFLFGGYYPLNAMFKPVVNGYRLILYRAQTGSISKHLDPKTKDIIKAVIK